MYRNSTEKQKENPNHQLNKEVMTTQKTVCKNYSGKGEASFNLYILNQSFLLPETKVCPFFEIKIF